MKSEEFDPSMCQRLKDDTLAKGGEISQIKIKKNKVK